MTEVVAALIEQGSKILICQRPACKARGLLWEFVGGKVEPGETKPEALARECREELGVSITVGAVFTEVTHRYPDLTVHLTLFRARIVSGEPQLLEHEALAWVTVGELDRYAFCPADTEILALLKGGTRPSSPGADGAGRRSPGRAAGAGRTGRRCAGCCRNA